MTSDSEAAGPTVEDFARLIEGRPWRVARTMPKHPHEYTRKREWETPDAEADFLEAVLLIRALGYPARYGGRTYTYLDYRGHHYWTMDPDPLDTILINRAVIPDAPLIDVLQDADL